MRGRSWSWSWRCRRLLEHWPPRVVPGHVPHESICACCRAHPFRVCGWVDGLGGGGELRVRVRVRVRGDALVWGDGVGISVSVGMGVGVISMRLSRSLRRFRVRRVLMLMLVLVLMLHWLRVRRGVGSRRLMVHRRSSIHEVDILLERSLRRPFLLLPHTVGGRRGIAVCVVDEHSGVLDEVADAECARPRALRSHS